MLTDLCDVGLVEGKRSDIERYDFKESGKMPCEKASMKNTRFIFRRRLLVIHVCKATHVRIFELLSKAKPRQQVARARSLFTHVRI